MIPEIHVMWIALISFGLGAGVMGVRWFGYELARTKADLPLFPRFPKFLFFTELLFTLISALFLYDVERTLLHYIFAICGVISLISITFIKDSKHGKK